MKVNSIDRKYVISITVAFENKAFKIGNGALWPIFQIYFVKIFNRNPSFDATHRKTLIVAENRNASSLIC